MKYLALIAIIFLTGCATQDYKAYADAQGAVAQAKANADTARYQALSQIAQTGTESARVAAVMALALGNGSQSQAQQIAAPQPSAALQWAGVLVPSITNLASLHYASRTAVASAEASARVAESTNNAFLGMAGKIQAPVVAAPVIPAANVSTVTTSTTTSNANQANVTTTSSANQANTTTTTSNANTTSTIGGTGVVGSGTTTTNANPTTTTTNPATQIPPGVVCSVLPSGILDCK